MTKFLAISCSVPLSIFLRKIRDPAHE
jgi:hypothetical protein